MVKDFTTDESAWPKEMGLGIFFHLKINYGDIEEILLIF